MADTNHKYVSEDGLTTLISLTKTELGKKANDSEVIKTINGEAPDSNGNIALDTGAGTVKSVNDVTPDEDGNLSLPQIDVSENVTADISYELGNNSKPNVPIKITVPKDSANSLKKNATIGDLVASSDSAFNNVTGLNATLYFFYKLTCALTGRAVTFEDNTDYTYNWNYYSYGPLKGFTSDIEENSKYLFKIGASTAKTGGYSPMDDTKKDTWLRIYKNWVTPAELTSAISALTSIKFSVVTELPTTGEDGTIYLVAHTHTDEDDSYDEYIWLSSTSKFEKIGNTDIDLSGYLKSTDVTTIDSAAVTTLWNSITA